MNIQGWFPLGLTGLISLQSKGPSRVFSSTTDWKHHSLVLSLPYGPTLTSVHDANLFVLLYGRNEQNIVKIKTKNKKNVLKNQQYD